MRDGQSLRKNTLVRQIARSNANQGVFLGLASSKRFVPAAVALLIQLAALVAVLMLVFVVNLIAPVRIPFIVLVLSQACLSAVLSAKAGMASWWRWIHFMFPIALWLMSMWHVPSDVYLVGFLISLSLFWTTFRSQVPFFPSRPIVWQKVAELIPQNRSIRMIDIGSGLGDLVMHVAKARLESRIEGIEIAPLPWVVSYLRAFLSRSKAAFKLGDYHALDFADYDVVFAYLSPAAMPALWEKANREMRTGGLLISYEFDIPSAKPSLIVDGKKDAPKIYVWKM